MCIRGIQTIVHERFTRVYTRGKIRNKTKNTYAIKQHISCTHILLSTHVTYHHHKMHQTDARKNLKLNEAAVGIVLTKWTLYLASLYFSASFQPSITEIVLVFIHHIKQQQHRSRQQQRHEFTSQIWYNLMSLNFCTLFVI